MSKKRLYENVSLTLAFLCVATLAACGSAGKGEEREKPVATKPPPVVEKAEPSVESFAVIREFKEKDTAALFALLPNEGGLRITRVTAPAFLGAYKSGKLSTEAMNYLFSKLTFPMPQSKKDEIVSKYKGAEVIYFEGYDGALCAGPDRETRVTVESTLSDLKLTTTFLFTAIPKPEDDCQFHSSMVMTQYSK